MSVLSKITRVILSIAILALVATNCSHGNISFRSKIDNRMTVVFDDVSYEAAMLYIYDIVDSNQLPGDEPHDIICEELSYSE